MLTYLHLLQLLILRSIMIQQIIKIFLYLWLVQPPFWLIVYYFTVFMTLRAILGPILTIVFFYDFWGFHLKAIFMSHFWFRAFSFSKRIGYLFLEWSFLFEKLSSSRACDRMIEIGSCQRITGVPKVFLIAFGWLLVHTLSRFFRNRNLVHRFRWWSHFFLSLPSVNFCSSTKILGNC